MTGIGFQTPGSPSARGFNCFAQNDSEVAIERAWSAAMRTEVGAGDGVAPVYVRYQGVRLIAPTR